MRKTVIKNKTKGNFVMVSKEILKDSRLKLRERGLLITLLSLKDDWDFSIRGLAAILPDGRDAIDKSFKKLIELGYVSIKPVRGENGTFAGNDVEIFEIPASAPITENPDTVIPYTVRPDAGKTSQYKNKKYRDIKEYKNKKRQCVNSFSQFNQRTYDYDALQREALGFS